MYVSAPVGETVAAFMSGMSGHAGSGGTAMASPSHGGGKGIIVLQDSPQLTTKVCHCSVQNVTISYLPYMGKFWWGKYLANHTVWQGKIWQIS